MRLVATVNGINVFSDKNLSGINGTRLDFSDGSWCNVQTGQVTNKGAGSISIGRSQEGSADEGSKTWGPKSYRAGALKVSGVEARVSIEPCDGNEIVVEITGTKPGVDAIRVREEGGGLLIEGTASGRGTFSQNVSIGGRVGISMSVVGFSGGVVHMDGAGISVSGGSSSADTQVKIKVPTRTHVDVSDAHGEVNIGDTDGDVVISVQGDWDAHVGRVRNAHLGLQGGADIDVAHVTGMLTVSLQGSGDIIVGDGQISSLNVSVQGSGDVRIGGVSQSATLSLQGSGDIDVSRVVSQPVRRSMGSGDIRVRRVG